MINYFQHRLVEKYWLKNTLWSHQKVPRETPVSTINFVILTYAYTNNHIENQYSWVTMVLLLLWFYCDSLVDKLDSRHTVVFIVNRYPAPWLRQGQFEVTWLVGSAYDRRQVFCDTRDWNLQGFGEKCIYRSGRFPRRLVQNSEILCGCSSDCSFFQSLMLVGDLYLWFTITDFERLIICAR